MTKKEFREWRERFGLTQDVVAKRFGLSRNTIQNWESGATNPPATVDDVCKAWENRLKQLTADLGPVTLCYTDAPMFVHSNALRPKAAMLQQEPYPTNAAALARVKEIWRQPGVHNPFIIDKTDTFLWTHDQLSGVVDRTDTDAPTLRNTLCKIGNYVLRNSTSRARGPRHMDAKNAEDRSTRIQEIGAVLLTVAEESEERVVSYSEFQGILDRLQKLGIVPSDRLVRNVAHAIEGQK